MLKLTIPQRRDPIARIGLFALIGTVAWVAVAAAAQPTAPVAAQSDIILMATATPALPTPVQNDPALALAAPTPAPGWIDQALGNVGAAADQFADSQAAQLAQEQAAAAAAAAEQAAREQYLANVGAQAAHSPRGDAPQPPPSFESGPIVQPPQDGEQIIIIDPRPQPLPPVEQMAAAVPHISAGQAAVIGERQSNGCPDGQVFYPRSGCHTPGSGGPQPGAVGAP